MDERISDERLAFYAGGRWAGLDAEISRAIRAMANELIVYRQRAEPKE